MVESGPAQASEVVNMRLLMFVSMLSLFLMEMLCGRVHPMILWASLTPLLKGSDELLTTMEAQLFVTVVPMSLTL